MTEQSIPPLISQGIFLTLKKCKCELLGNRWVFIGTLSQACQRLLSFCISNSQVQLQKIIPLGPSLKYIFSLIYFSKCSSSQALNLPVCILSALNPIVAQCLNV